MKSFIANGSEDKNAEIVLRSWKIKSFVKYSKEDDWELCYVFLSEYKIQASRTKTEITKVKLRQSEYKVQN